MDNYTIKKTILGRIGLCLAGLIVMGFVFALVFYLLTSQLGTMIFALLIGGTGACISFFLRFSKMRPAEMEFLATSWWAILVPVLVGVTMGGFIFIVFFAGILTGDGGSGLFTSNLFPLFTEPSISNEALLNLRDVLAIRPVTVQDFGKLLVWCFLAGYSERLVPNILQTIEKKGVGDNQNS